MGKVCSYVPNNRGITPPGKTTISRGATTGRAWRRRRDGRSQGWTTEALTYPTLKCWKSAHFFFGGGGICVHISGDVAYFKKHMYTMYSKFLNHWNIFGNTFPHFSGWWFQTFVIIVIFIPKLVEDEPILTSMFFKWVGSATNQFYVSPRSFKIMIQQIWSHEWGSQPLKFPQCQLQYHWGQKNTPEDYRLEHNSLDGWQIIFLSKWVICRLFDVICRWSNRSSSRVYLILFL